MCKAYIIESTTMTVAEIIDKYYPIGNKSREYYLPHVEAVADYARHIVQRHPELRANLQIVIEGAMLHDIGCCMVNAPKIGCYGKDRYICHGILGAEILKKEGLEKYANICLTHIGTGITVEIIRNGHLPLPLKDMIPTTIEEQIICYADKFFSKSSSNLRQSKELESVRDGISKYGQASLDNFDRMHSIMR